jgi:pimeloyl-ACP methyl ester carboxylesterase
LAPSTPALLAAATFDPVSVARRRRDAEALGSDFVELRDVGHNVMVDVGSRAAASTVLDWLDSRLPAK